MIVAKKFSTLAMAVALTLSVPALSGCESTTSNSQTTGRSQLMLVSSEKVMQDKISRDKSQEVIINKLLDEMSIKS